MKRERLPLRCALIWWLTLSAIAWAPFVILIAMKTGASK